MCLKVGGGGRSERNSWNNERSYHIPQGMDFQGKFHFQQCCMCSQYCLAKSSNLKIHYLNIKKNGNDELFWSYVPSSALNQSGKKKNLQT